MNKRRRRAVRAALREAQSGRCAYCGRPTSDRPGEPRSGTIDHVIPRCRGGSNWWDNLVLACQDCNWRLGSSDRKPILLAAVATVEARLAAHGLLHGREVAH